MDTIDESLYSRQMYVFKKEDMKSFKKSDVLICGLNGLGVEIAKNLILSGIKSVTLYDENNITENDLASNYYCTKENIGENIVTACINKLKELNGYVTVKKFNEELSEENLKRFTTVCITQKELKFALKINNICRKCNVHFVMADSYSVFGRIFIDFGNKFIINDPDDEKPASSLIKSIDKNIITCIDTKPHKLYNGDYVKLTNIEGMPELDKIQQIKVKVIDRYKFELCDIDINKYGKYINGGLIKQVKQRKQMCFDNLEKSLETPNIMMIDYVNMNRGNILHYLFNNINNTSKADVVSKISEIMDITDSDKDLISKFVNTWNNNIVATNSIIGGITTQEILKGCSGKFTPIHQWLYYESVDSLPTKYEKNNTTKYGSYLNIFGKDIQNKIFNTKMFMVGTGAIGSELLKNFAMSGVGKNGSITITDMDIIEKSNLNRQFLFRTHNIGKSKSVSAKEAILKMNPDINIIAHENRVGKESENLYNGSFYENIDIVANALDNVKARNYVDSRCVLFNKPLLESGTKGTKGNVQVILPHITESYGSSVDPPEESIPMCTIKTFPNTINHTIEFIKQYFEETFTDAPLNVKKYMDDKSFLNDLEPTAKNKAISDINNILYHNYASTFDDCIKYAFNIWYELFNHQILRLQEEYPKDHIKDGVLFWTGEKKYPTVVNFNINNDLCYGFILAFSNLWADIFGINRCNNKEYICKVVSTLKEPEYIKEKKEEEIFSINKDIKLGININPLEFEKDDDNNYHIDFITNGSNLRATNYGIEPIDRHETKGIAGNIIPALVTTTSVVAGLCMMEMYKILQGNTDIEKYRNTYINLSLPLISYSEPVKCDKFIFNDKEFTIWDNIKIDNCKIISELIEEIEERYECGIEQICYDAIKLYDEYWTSKKKRKILNNNIKEHIEYLLDKKLETDVIKLEILPEIDDDEADVEIMIPPILLKLIN